MSALVVLASSSAPPRWPSGAEGGQGPRTLGGRAKVRTFTSGPALVSLVLVRPGRWSLGRCRDRTHARGMTSESTLDAVPPTPELLRAIEPSRCLQLLQAVQYGRL